MTMQDFGSLKIFGDHDPGTIQQMWTCLGAGPTAGGVLCADGHKGYAQPVGGVVAYPEHISISGVGFDIGCGNTAVRTSTQYNQIKDRVPAILKDIGSHIAFGIGKTSKVKVDWATFDDDEAWATADVEDLRQMAVGQLGTVGSGNHYVDLLEDEDGFVWVGVHFGSRGLGHKSATKYLKLAGGKDGMDVAPCIVHQDSELGIRYRWAMELAGGYAKAGREAVCKTVLRLLGARATKWVNNHHNYAWREIHGGKELWVVRKGATPAFPGQEGFVGGSMGDNAVIIEGVDSDLSKASMYSTVHGAGRIMSRSQAKKTFDRAEMDQWLVDKGVSLLGGDLDESPMAYRRLNEVLTHHDGTIKVNHTLRPFAVAMAGKGDFDPYKD
jgi:tRNA-splicing ligase RtcB (3'-phosphate/5'-hydroxy nucleic acid ligase)